MIHNPYAGVDWDRVTFLHSINHTHTFSVEAGGKAWLFGDGRLDGQKVFDSMYVRGIRHFAISNYHPAKPTYPLKDHFQRVPDDAIGCPNAEHSLAKDPGHFSSLGSYFQSRNAVIPTWKQLFDQIFAELAYADGGGVVINHPKRTRRLTRELLLTMLDYDPRVLGIEAYNDRSEMTPKYKQTGDALSIWDELLSTGRRVFGFFNPDYHSPWNDDTRGRNVLVVDEVTEEAAARAYRQGHFYGAFKGTRLCFDRILVDGGAIRVRIRHGNRIDFISGGKIVHTGRGQEAVYSLTGDEVYVRVEAGDASGDRVFSQPVMFQPRAEHGV